MGTPPRNWRGYWLATHLLTPLLNHVPTHLKETLESRSRTPTYFISIDTATTLEAEHTLSALTPQQL